MNDSLQPGMIFEYTYKCGLLNRIFGFLVLFFLAALLWTVSSCSKPETHAGFRDTGSPFDEPAISYKVLNSYPHDRNAFTQGLVIDDGILYEGTGLYGQSTIRKVELETGKILQVRKIPLDFFGEGITLFGTRIIQLTWKSNVGFVYDKDSFKLIKTFHYPTDGWGITHDGTRLIISDGTSTLRLLDPNSFQELGRIDVRGRHGPVEELNELEYIQGEIYANIFRTDFIVKINPQTGKVTGWIYLKGLLRQEEIDHHIGVLNGIAYDSKNNRLFVTGKQYPRLFEIELIE